VSAVKKALKGLGSFDLQIIVMVDKESLPITPSIVTTSSGVGSVDTSLMW
jgi:hypothetical protein